MYSFGKKKPYSTRRPPHQIEWARIMARRKNLSITAQMTGIYPGAFDPDGVLKDRRTDAEREHDRQQAAERALRNDCHAMAAALVREGMDRKEAVAQALRHFNLPPPTAALPATALPATALPTAALPAVALPAAALPATALPATALPAAAPRVVRYGTPKWKAVVAIFQASRTQNAVASSPWARSIRRKPHQTSVQCTKEAEAQCADTAQMAETTSHDDVVEAQTAMDGDDVMPSVPWPSARV